MIGSRLYLPARGQSQPVDRLSAAREDVSHRASGVLKTLVQRPDRHLGGARRQQLTKRHLAVVVRTSDGANFLEGFKKYLGAGDGEERRSQVGQRSKEPAFASR